MAFPTNAAPQSVKVRRNQLGWEEGGAVVVVASPVLAVDDDEAIIKEVLVLLVAPSFALAAVVVVATAEDVVVVGKNPPLRSDTGTTCGTTTLLLEDAAGSTANRVDTIPDLASTGGGALAPATRRKSSSTKTADGCVSRTNCPASAADCSEMCAVPSK